MKKFILLAILAVVAGSLVFLSYPFVTIYGLCRSDLELLFVVVDAETGMPIPGATVSLREDFDEPGGPRKSDHVKDEAGRAVFLRKGVKCEQIVTPFQRTRWAFDLTWGDYDVMCPGYDGVLGESLYGSNRENLGIVSENRCFRVQITAPLRKALTQAQEAKR